MVVATLDAHPEKVWTTPELLQIAFSHQPYFAPGTNFYYSNTNYELLGLIAEQIGQAPLAQPAHDLSVWGKAPVTGQLLSQQTQRERLDLTGPAHYGLGIESEFGLIGHNGALPGFQSFLGDNPDKGATVIVFANIQAARTSTSATHSRPTPSPSRSSRRSCPPRDGAL